MWCLVADEDVLQFREQFWIESFSETHWLYNRINAIRFRSLA